MPKDLIRNMTHIGVWHIKYHHGVGAIAKFLMTNNNTQALDESGCGPGSNQAQYDFFGRSTLISELLKGP
jgi:hypothetical protein